MLSDGMGPKEITILFKEVDAMKRFIAVLLTVSFLAVGAVVALAEGPAEVKFETKMGDVTFPHETHQGFVSDCTTCHHKGLEAGTCKDCHDGTKAPKAKDAFHDLCKGCHKEKNGPTGCKDCHKK